MRKSGINHTYAWLIAAALLGVGLLLLLTLIAPGPLAAQPAFAQGGEDATPEPETPPIEAGMPTDNENYCVLCHGEQGRTVTLEDGSTLDLYVDPTVLEQSVHGSSMAGGGLACTDCHGESTFPHVGPAPENMRVFAINAAESCSSCHNQVLADSAHVEAIAEGNLEAATCADCHGAHDVVDTAQQVDLVAGVCGDCHTTTYAQWEQSPHANMDRLGCAVCHRPHGQELIHADASQLCLSCHRVPGEIYVHDTHLASDFPVSCTSCHMNYDPDLAPLSPEGEPTDHHMQVGIVSCNTCHAELEASGVMAQLSGEAELISERDQLQEQLSTLEGQLEEAELAAEQAAAEPDEDNGTNVALFVLALIIGLVLGVGIILVVFPNLRE